MPHTLLVVEGAHDAAFFGHLLHDRGYRSAQILGKVPAFWQPLIPRRYPVDPEGRLDRIMMYPNIHVGPEGSTVGVAVAGGEKKIVSTLRTPLEQLGIGNFHGIGVVVDADRELPTPERFQRVLQSLDGLNHDATAEGVPGFPIPWPKTPGAVIPGPPRSGIYLFPDNANQGLLETVLLDCAAMNVPRFRRGADLLVKHLDRHTPAENPDLRSLRSASGADKAVAGIIATVLKPGASLAASLRSDAWLRGEARNHPLVVAADSFLGDLL